MSEGSNSTERRTTYGPVEIDRRTLTKLAGMAGVAVFTPQAVGSVEAAETDGVTIQMNIQPLYDRVLVQKIEEEERTAGGIIIPNSAQEKPEQGIVRATGDGPVGDDGEQIKLVVSEGDRVLYEEDAGVEVTIAGEEHLVLQEGEILAIINV